MNTVGEDPPVELDPEYEAELFRRLEEIDSGRAKLLSLDEVMMRLRTPQSDPFAGDPPR